MDNWQEHVKILTVNKTYQVPTRGESILDPAGRVFEFEDGIYRAITKGYVPTAKAILASPVIDKIFEVGLIETEFCDLQVDGYAAVLKHRKIDFQSLSYEWSPSTIRDGAKMVAALGRILYENGYSYRDGNMPNVLIDYTNPKFIDFTSLLAIGSLPNSRRLEPLDFPWEFSGIYIHNWFSLLSKYTSNITKDGAYSIRKDYINDALSFFDAIVDYLDSAEFEYETTEWRGYGGSKFNFQDLNPKHQAFYDFLVTIQSDHVNTLLDIGGNKGLYSLVAQDLGWKVVNFDIDIYSIMQLYEYLKGTDKQILPLVINFLSPMKRIRGLPSAVERLKCDVTVFLALIHHLCLRQGIIFEQIIDQLDAFTKYYCIVEFIPLGDKHVGNWAKPSWYRQQNFVVKMKERGFQLINQAPSSPSPRTMLLFARSI